VYLGKLQLYTFIQLSQIGCTLVQSCGCATMSIRKHSVAVVFKCGPLLSLLLICAQKAVLLFLSLDVGKGNVVVLVIRRGQRQMHLLHFFITHLHKKGLYLVHCDL
jgi:hypothetical protein